MNASYRPPLGSMKAAQSYRKQALRVAARIHAATSDLRLIPWWRIRRRWKLARAIRADRAMAGSLVHLRAAAMFEADAEGSR